MASGTRQRIVDAAMELFADKGYAATTVGEIEAAAGLQPRAGGMYRHFPSKEAVLATGVRAQLDALAAFRSVDTAGWDVDLRTLLRLCAAGGLWQLSLQRAFHRIIYRDLEQFPELLAEVQEQMVWSSVYELADRLAMLAKAGRVREVDFLAVAEVAVGSLVHHRLVEATLGVAPPVDDERLVAAWVEVFTAMLEPPAPPIRRRQR